MIQEWYRGKEEILLKKFGKEMRSVLFTDPRTNIEEEFVLFGSKDWSVVLPLTTDMHVVAVRQYKQGCDKIIRELPAGAADFGNEKPEDAARRELLEETGYEAAENILFLGPPLWISTRSSWTRFWPFLATGCKKVADQKLDDLEDIEIELIPLDEWIRQTLSEIEEPSAVVATFRALHHLGYSIKK